MFAVQSQIAASQAQISQLAEQQNLINNQITRLAEQQALTDEQVRTTSAGLEQLHQIVMRRERGENGG